jgi:hypothetical protein
MVLAMTTPLAPEPLRGLSTTLPCFASRVRTTAVGYRPARSPSIDIFSNAISWRGLGATQSARNRGAATAVSRPIADRASAATHVNGKWLASTEIPADKASYGSFDKPIGDSEAQLRGIVEGLQTSGAAKDADNRFARTPCRSEEAPCRRFHPGLFAGRLQATAGAGAMLLPA